MKVVLRGYGVGMNSQQRQNAKIQARTMTQTYGTAQMPKAPGEVYCQTGPQGLLVTWNLPEGFNADIQRWRVYKGNESTLYAEVKDRGTRQQWVAATDASPVNIFVSSVNAAGVESTKVHSQGTPGASTVPVPSVPPEFNDIASGGGDTSTDFQ